MPDYSYVAIDKSGRQKKGKIEALDRKHAIDLLKSDGMTPIKVYAQGAFQKELQFSFGKSIKPRDLSVLCRQFVSIIQAGVPLKQALQMLSEQTENKTLRDALIAVLNEVERGNTLSDAMRLQSKVFPSILIDMVTAGEVSGSLDLSFARMAVQFEKEAKLKATIKKATIYPIILVLASIAVVIVMLLFVIPQFISMFADIDIEMPAFTMAVMNASSWLGTHWYLIPIVVVLTVGGYKAFYQTEGGREKIDKIKIRLPLFGKLTVKSICAQFARTTGTLMGTGIPIISCLEIMGRIVNNVHYTRALAETREEVMKGVPLSEPLKASGLFPPMVYHMIHIGEETGNMEDMLEKLADYYDEEVEMTTQTVMAAMEPLIIVIMAVIIGALVMAVVAPIGTMYQGLDNL